LWLTCSMAHFRRLSNTAGIQQHCWCQSIGNRFQAHCTDPIRYQHVNVNLLLSSHLKSTPLILNSSRQSHRRGLQSLQQCLRHSTDRHYALGKCHCAVFVACYNSMGRRSHLYVSAIQIDCFTPCLYSSLIDCALRQTVLC
jgi:hypothetical protein